MNNVAKNGIGCGGLFLLFIVGVAALPSDTMANIMAWGIMMALPLGIARFIFRDLFESIDVLRNSVDTLTSNCIVGITANPERCRELMEMSVGVATALCPYIGYQKAAEIAKDALRTRRSVRDLVLERGLMDEETLAKVEDPYAMTEPAQE